MVDQLGILQANTVGSLWLQVQCHSSLEFLATLRVMPTLLQSLQVSRCLWSRVNQAHWTCTGIDGRGHFLGWSSVSLESVSPLSVPMWHSLHAGSGASENAVD